MSAVLSDILIYWDRLSCQLAQHRHNVLLAKRDLYSDEMYGIKAERDRVLADFNDLISGLKTAVGVDARQFNAVELLFDKTPFLQIQKRLQNCENILTLISERLDEDQRDLDLQELYRHISDLSNIPGQNSIKSVVGDFILAFATGGSTYALKEYMNFLLLGPPGIGKTRFATMIARIMGSLGILVDGSVTIVSRGDFVGQYVGDTSIKTQNLLSNNLEKCLIIDEAYLLGQEEKNSFGHEAIGAMVNFLDKHKGQCVLMALGYEEDMKKYFLGINPGMNRRFPLRISLQTYQVSQMREILESMLHVGGLPKTKLPESTLFDALLLNGYFVDQAGDMENMSAFIIRRILSSGRRELTEALLLNVAYKYLLSKDENIFLDDSRIENRLTAFFDEDEQVHQEARREYQSQAPDCPTVEMKRRSDRLAATRSSILINRNKRNRTR